MARTHILDEVTTLVCATIRKLRTDRHEAVPPSPVDFSQIESKEVKAPSADGTMVPLSIIHKRESRWMGHTPHGSRPTAPTGSPSIPPSVPLCLHSSSAAASLPSPTRAAAASTARTGTRRAETDQAAHHRRHARRRAIPHRAQVHIAAHLAGEGTSAGGITIGGAITQRPDLFGAALIRVGDSDSLRSELMASGPANIPEFGTVKDPDGFKALYAMDAYST